MQQTVAFPDGDRLIDGVFMRRDEMRGARFILDHPYWSVEVWVPQPVEGFKFRLNMDETWTAVPK